MLPPARPSLYNVMMTTPPTRSPRAYSPSVDNLRNLLIIRSIALLGQTGVLIYVLLASRTTESLLGVTVSLVVLALLTMASLWRTTRPWPVADNEFLAQLFIDVLGWTALMYFTGGANNPFVSYYIVPLVIAAAVLPWRHTWLITGSSLLAYSLLLYFYVPFPLFTPHAAMGHGDGANVHILGMWFNFLFSAHFARAGGTGGSPARGPSAQRPDHGGGQPRRRHCPRTGYTTVHHDGTGRRDVAGRHTGQTGQTGL